MACGPFFEVELILIASLSNRLQFGTCSQCRKTVTVTHVHNDAPYDSFMMMFVDEIH